MFLPEGTTAFTDDQLRQLDAFVAGEYPGLVSWARDLNLAHPPAVKDLALIATWSLLQTSQRHENDFRSAVTAGHDITVEQKSLGYRPPIDSAARAAGLAVKASLYIAWYDLRPDAFVTEPVDMFQAMSDPRSEPLDRVVGASPQQIGLVDFTAQSVNHAVQHAAHEAMYSSGPEAFGRFVQGRPPLEP